MRRVRAWCAEELADLLEDRAPEQPLVADAELAPLTRLAAELRDHAEAPPSPRRAALRAELVARRAVPGQRRATLIGMLAGAILTLTAGVALAALPAAAPVRDAMHDVVESLLGTWVRPPAVTPSPSAKPIDGSDVAPGASSATPVRTEIAPGAVPGGSAVAPGSSPPAGPSPGAGDGASPSARPGGLPPPVTTPSPVAPPSPPRPGPFPPGSPRPIATIPVVSAPPAP